MKIIRMRENLLNVTAVVICAGAMTLCACVMNRDSFETQKIQPGQDGIAAARSEHFAEDSQLPDLHPDSGLLGRPVSDVEATVRLEGDFFYKLQFAAGGQQVYVCGSREEPPASGSLADDTYFVGVADVPVEAEETFRVRELSLNMPTDMRVFRMAVDRAGNCHLLWVSKAKTKIDGEMLEAFTYEKSRIMVINADGEVLRETDTSETLAEVLHGAMYCFAVDDAGNYYMERGTEIVKLDTSGKLQSCIACGGRVEGIGCGRSGAVYCVCRGSDNAERLCRVQDDRDGVTILGILPETGIHYPRVGAGTDTELILFHREGGIYTVDMGREIEHAEEETSEETGVLTAELRVPEAKLPVTGQEIGGDGILGDGRVCLFYQDAEEILIYYIPVSLL